MSTRPGHTVRSSTTSPTSRSSACFEAGGPNHETRQRRWAAGDAGSVGPNDQRAVDNPTTCPLPERPPRWPESSPRRTRRLPWSRRRRTHQLALPNLRCRGVGPPLNTHCTSLDGPGRIGGPSPSACSSSTAVTSLAWRVLAVLFVVLVLAHPGSWCCTPSASGVRRTRRGD